MKYLRNVVTLKLDAEKCIGCELCIDVCPHEVFKVNKEIANIIDLDACMECGACAGNCPVNALSVSSGVGCASAVIKGWLTGSEPTCDCSDSECC